jgi:hypothetical protein
MAEAYLASLLPGKAHLARTADGFLICKDVCIARSGPMQYLASELDIPGGAQRVTVWREPEEITNRRFLASCEGAVVTDQHPGRFVDPGNYMVYTRGHMQNARVGPKDADGNTTALADLFINDDGLARKVESGLVRDVSIGYNLDVVKDAIGRWSQVNLRVNHCAVVPVGRAGSTRILDAAPALGLTELAALYLGQNPAAVSVPSRAFDSREETVMTTRNEALHWLRQIKPDVRDRGDRAQKIAWNALYSAIRDGEDPDQALEDLRQFSGRVMAADSVPTDAQRSKDFVEMCAGYLGQDPKEVAKKQKERAPLRTADQLHRAIFESPAETATENFLRLAEEAGEEMRNKWKY